MIKNREHLIRDMQEELFQKQDQGWFRIMSGSMRPLMDIDDRVLARPVDPEEVKPGDIILFRNSDALVTHRVVKVIRHNGKAMILQRGDAGGTPGTITPEAIVGKVVGIEKNGRFLRLDHGRIGFLNSFLGVKNCYLYPLDEKIRVVKGWLRDKPGFRYMRAVYRVFKW